METKEQIRKELSELIEHASTLSKDTEEYDRTVANIAVLQKALNEAEQADSERIRKDKERVQAIKQWQAEKEQRDAEIEDARAQFMIRIIADTAMRLLEDALYVDMYDRDMMFEQGDTHSTKFGVGLRNRIPFMRRR